MSNLYTNELRRRPRRPVKLIGRLFPILWGLFRKYRSSKINSKRTVCPAASEAAVLLKKKGLVKKKGLDFRQPL